MVLLKDLENIFNMVKIKTTKPILVISIEGYGKIADFEKDLDKLYSYLYENSFQENLVGPSIGIFHTEHGGKYEVAIPINKPILVKGTMRTKTIPSIKCISILHKGSYKTIEHSFNLLKDYVKKNKLIWMFPVMEHYIKSNGPEETYLTEIQVPIKKLYS